MKHNWRWLTKIAAILLVWCVGGSLNSTVGAESPKESEMAVLTGKITIEREKGPIRTAVKFQSEGLKANQPVQLIWMTKKGAYQLEGIYSFIGTVYQEQEVILFEGKANGQGEWTGTFQVPEGFGGDHTVYVRQAGSNVAQTNFFVETTFSMSPQSGPIGNEITIVAEGLGSSTMESNWQLTYDNKMTGLISAVSTDGKAVAKIRAAGPVGKHTLTVWHGYLGIPYINHQQAPTAYLPVPSFTFEVTDEKSVSGNRVEPVPASPAGGGVIMPAVQNKPGVQVTLSKDQGIVGEEVTLKAKGLPAGKKVDVDWTTMVGNRVTTAGFSEKQHSLGQAVTDGRGNLTFDFSVPDDLGGVPHRIDLKITGEVYGQSYLKIVPSIVSMTPQSGPAGTEITIELKGVGWTEFDNTYFLTYDNAYMGYMCGFNSQGTVKFNMFASGEPGYHIIDLYPGIYKGKTLKPDIYLAPQLTYEQDHPGSAIPAIRLGFEITE